MCTLIAVYNSEGCVGRCDAKCYDAETLPCVCICGGRNHGAGIAVAKEQTRELAGEWIERYKRERGLGDDAEALVSLQILQEELEL